MKNKEEKITSVAQSYMQRRRPLDKKIPPHVRYNPDTLNQKYIKEEENEM